MFYCDDYAIISFILHHTKEINNPQRNIQLLALVGRQQLLCKYRFTKTSLKRQEDRQIRKKVLLMHTSTFLFSSKFLMVYSKHYYNAPNTIRGFSDVRK